MDKQREDIDLRNARAYEDCYSDGGFLDQVKKLEAAQAANQSEIERLKSDLKVWEEYTGQVNDRVIQLQTRNAELVGVCIDIKSAVVFDDSADWNKILTKLETALSANQESAEGEKK